MDDRISITICGDGGCGKSSITLRIVRSQWTHEYDPTIEDSYSVTRTIDGTNYSLSITDTAGQEEYRGMWSASNLSSDAFLLVYDITNRGSMQALDFFAELIEVEREARRERGECWPAIMVVGNKCDLQGQRQVGASEGLEWARLRDCGFMETSARDMVNIEETFGALVKRVVEARTRYAAGERVVFPSLVAPMPPPKPLPQPPLYAQQRPPEAYEPAPAPAPSAPASGFAQYNEKTAPSQTDSLQTARQPRKKKSFLSSLRCW